MTRHCESTPLRIGEAQAPPAYLLFEHAILLAEIGDHLKLMAIHPAGERDHSTCQRMASSIRRVYRLPPLSGVAEFFG